ncbi:glycosyltransferase [Psychromonas sp. KJ10-10]|uniref:glycosyltransferase n=1 Tax=Psychromonas sp. KJ10-10 TaxID=3391823 RepID=UPI0039B4D6D1
MNTVLQIVQHLRPGGIETLALDLCNFNHADERVLIVSLEGTLEQALKAWPRLEAMRAQLIFLDKQPGLRPSLVSQLVKIIKQSGAQTVHSHHIGPLLYAGLATRISGVKHFIHTEHDAWHLQDSKRRRLQRWAVKITRPTLVADAQTVAINMQEQLNCDQPITVIRNGIDSEYFIPGNSDSARDRLKLPNNVKIIGCSGRLEKVKGQAILIEALAKLPNDTHLALAGSGSMEEKLKQLVSEPGLQKRVHFLGHIDSMPEFYQALDVFCLPSLNEGFPLSPLEAQACDIATLVTDVGGAKETLCPDSGKFVIANNSEKMAQELLSMSHQPCAMKPRKHIKAQGDVRVMANAYRDLRTPVGQGA